MKTSTAALLVIAITGTLVPTLHSAEPIAVRDTEKTTQATNGVRIVKGSVELPRDGAWFIENRFSDQGGLTEIYLQGVENPNQLMVRGERMAKLAERRAILQRRSLLQNIYWACSNAAFKAKGLAPESLDEIKNNSVVEEREGVHYIPGLRVYKKVDGQLVHLREGGELMLIDMRPAVDDGKHWVTDSTGKSERRKIDKKLMKSLGITIDPSSPSVEAQREDESITAVHSIYARLAGEPGKVELTARNFLTEATLPLIWDTTKATAGGDAISRDWATLRIGNFFPAVRSDAPVGSVWVARTADQYDLDDKFSLSDFSGRGRRQGRTTSAMGVLGGRAAIQETLQLRELRAAAAEDGKSWDPVVPIGEIPGVEVAAHPFKKMLGENPGGRLPLAEWVPHDRFLAYFPKISGLFSMLEGGSDFIFAAGGTMTGRSAAYGLKDRYLDRLGLSEEILKRFFETGVIGEMALTVPDFFLIDGTDISAIMRIEKPLLAAAAFAMVGVPPGDGLTVKKTAGGKEIYWMRRGPILIVSTSKAELDAILKAKEKGKNLAESAELRYMLTKVPLTAETAIFVYFSDPFIRKLVGPRAKIGQLRRLLARAELEEASAASLLAKFDGHGEEATKLPFLLKGGYISNPVYAADLKLDKRGVSRSETFGTAARLEPLSALPLDLASEEERKAYGEYLEDYNRYWRRFFDPIAIRYEQHPGGVHQLETFILPLIENSIYGGLREFLPEAGADVPLRVPVLDPKPVAMMSFNLQEDSWIDWMEGMSDMFEQVVGLDGSLLDLLGPDVHIALHDADPIISIGSGEMGKLFGTFGGGGADDFAIPLIVSTLTRPCTIHLGLSDPDLAREKLTRMTWNPEARLNVMPSNFGSGSLYQVSGEEKWIYRWSVEEIVTLRLGIEVQGRYLVINNLPFSNGVAVTGSKRAPNDAGYLELNPVACIEQLPSLFASAVEKTRGNAIGGAACLLPFLMAGVPEISTAQKNHQDLFGFEPHHPGGGSWTWDEKRGELVSSLYGRRWAQQQPAFDPENEAVGMFRAVSHVDLGMQFEQDGLRSTVRWTLR